jgi:5-methylcytosine-specific restriction protein B
LNFINQKINQNQKVIQHENILPALPHVLIIDEINRGNVSQIFGELITLIEDSKRIGEVEALEVTLSYSKKKFGVPSNVYIIGTMNTADRSVEALDTALRRRFSFVEMMPDYEIKELDYLIYNCKVTDILKKINTRIEMLLGRDYVIGHSYFLEKTSSEINEIKEAIEGLNLLLELKNSKHENFELKIEIDKLKKLLFEKESSKNKNDALNLLNSFDKNIMPLLQEYFYNDYGKIGLVLGKGFVREKAITANNEKSIFADFDTKNEVDITKSYELIPFTEINFETAIQRLLA